MKSLYHRSFLLALLFIAATFTTNTSQAQEDSLWTEANFKGLEFRSIGPAFMGGRIADIAIHPEDEGTWYVAVGSGGVFKTENAGTTWKPIFEDYSSYSTGCITIDPNDHERIWLGTGENVGGRHAGYGDGIYLSEDGGSSWKNMGLKTSEHISKIIVHPSYSNIIWVAAQGPLWSEGGERGVYKSTDGGETWKRTLGDDKWMGATDMVIDPRDPNRIYAATWERHRTVAAYMGGGPGSGIHRSTDGGETWTKLTSGLPNSNMGKIGLAISPQRPDVLYAAIELDQRKGGLYKSTNRGSSWAKQSDAVSGATGPHYYQELYASPHQFDRLYLMDVRVQVSDDGGKSFRTMKENDKHSDNHSLAFKKSDPDYLLVGTDGGIYESYDLAENWRFINNLPITQFYKLALDDAEPFYNVYGGTQDNSTEGGPSRTDNRQGIQNSDWKVVLGWDGHQPATEPGNPNIMYGQRQEGNLTRIDLATGEVVQIHPQAGPDDPHERYNWDAPILVSPHSPTRIYHGSYRLWKSDDRGDSWDTISGDLTNGYERMELPIMGRKQSIDNAWDLLAMSNYSTITSIAESPVQANLLYVGTDDGLIQVSEDGGDNWRKIRVGSMPGVPPTAYVNNIVADLFDANVVYAALDNHKYGDYKPYLLKSTNKGETWKSISAGIPDRHLVWRLVQDTEKADVLFIGTEFGVFFTHDGGSTWTKLKGGMPNIPVRDIAIQRREDDLVAATFGRSFYVYDDIAVFREVDDESLKAEAKLFSARDAWWYIPKSHLGFYGKRGSMGGAHYVADNPPFGAVFTYHLGEGYESMAAERKKEEKEKTKTGEDIAFPGWDVLQDEKDEIGTKVWLVVSDEAGNEIRKIKGPNGKGFHRIAWDLRYPGSNALLLDTSRSSIGQGPLVMPGNYQVELFKEENGEMTSLSEKQSFEVKKLYEGSVENPMADQLASFWDEIADVSRRRSALVQDLAISTKAVAALYEGADGTTGLSAEFGTRLNTLRAKTLDLNHQMYGNEIRNQIGEKNPPILGDRMFDLYLSGVDNTYGPTPRAMDNLTEIKNLLDEFEGEEDSIRTEVDQLASELYKAGGPAIQGINR